jgi:hypothetical protein
MAATKEEAAAALGVSRPTLWKFLEANEEAQEVWDRGFDEAKTSLRRLQWRLAKTNTAMAIFLGKQLLGQKDQYGLEHGGKMDVSMSTVRDGIQRKLARISEASPTDGMASEPNEG